MDVALMQGLQLKGITTVQFKKNILSFITRARVVIDSRHLEVFAGVERTEEINSNVLFCFIWKVAYSLISLRQ